MSEKNKKPVAGLLVVVLFLIVGPFPALKGVKSGGSDDVSNVVVKEIAGEYEPWFTLVLEILIDGELPGKIESLLFCVQTSVGVGVLAFCMGHLVEWKKWANKENKMTAQDGHENIIFRFPMV